MIFTSGNKYKGQIENGRPHGEGVYLYSNGDKYKGEFVNGEKHGQGVETYADKRPKKDGLWVYGSFKSNKI